MQTFSTERFPSFKELTVAEITWEISGDRFFPGGAVCLCVWSSLATGSDAAATSEQWRNCSTPPLLPYTTSTALHHPYCPAPPLLSYITPIALHHPTALHLPYCPTPLLPPYTTTTALHHP